MGDDSSGSGGGGSGWLWFIAGAIAFGILMSQAANQQNGSSTTGGGTVTAPATAPATLDPESQHFLSIAPGDCLRNYYGGGWGTQQPEVTDCGRVDAFYTVTGGGVGARCASDKSSTEWAHYSDYYTDYISICVTRRYKAEQCFAGEPRGEEVFARLDTVWPCDTDSVPQEGDQILRITGYYRSPDRPADRTCTSDPYDTTYYYTWDLHGGDDYLCAVITD